MKSRITLTIDPAVSHRARAAARARGQSLSSLVELLLEKETGGALVAKTGTPFSRRWAGKVKLAAKVEPRFAKLKQKYHL